MDLPSNLWKSPIIKERLVLEANFDGNHGLPAKPFFWVLVPEADRKDGTIVLKNFEPSISNIEPHPLQQDFARGLQQELQKEAGFNGLWLVGWTHPPSSYGALTDTDNCWNRLIFIWHDKDGDPQYTVESELPFVNVIQHGMDYYVGLAHKSHDQWREIYSEKAMKQDMMLTEDQQKRMTLEALAKQ